MERKNLDEAMEELKKIKRENGDCKQFWAIEYVGKVIEDVVVFLDKKSLFFELDIGTLFTEQEKNLNSLEITHSEGYDKGRDKGILETLNSINEIMNPEIISEEWKFEKKEKNREYLNLSLAEAVRKEI